jgi:tripartite-type tricarboxylate transporter receptor subunit TctC
MKRLQAGIALVILAMNGAAEAQPYPARRITIVVPAAAGGVSDVLARAVGQRLAEAWGQQVIVENKGGANHIIGAATVAKAAPDGYTLMVGAETIFVINPHLYAKGKLPYDVDKDFAPITGLVGINQGLLAHPSLPANDLRELIGLAKAKPGEITYGTSGPGSAGHVNVALLESMAGVKLVPVHYRGAAPALNDVIAGHVHLISVSLSAAVRAWRAAQVKLLSVGSARRLPHLPDVPAAAESGLPGYEAVTWFGLFTTGGVPREIVDKVNTQVQRVFSDAGFREKFLAPSMFESMVASPQHFADFIRSERIKWGKVIRDANLKIE